MSGWAAKQARKQEFAINKMLDTGGDNIDFEGTLAKDVRDAAMGKGDDELFEKKMTKEEKKALAKAKREAKKKVRSVWANSAILDEVSTETHLSFFITCQTGQGRFWKEPEEGQL